MSYDEILNLLTTATSFINSAFIEIDKLATIQEEHHIILFDCKKNLFQIQNLKNQQI